MKKVYLFTALIIILSMLLSSCGGAAKANTIKIGGIAEITGDIPAVGQSYKNAMDMRLKEVTDAGGLDVGGKKYQVVVSLEDNGGKADQSASVAQKLITQDNVVGIIGPNASRYAIPASEVAEANKTVLITPWSTNPKTTIDAKTNQPKQYVFRACFIDPFQGHVIAKFALDKLGYKKAAVLYDVASDYNKGIAEYFKQTYEANGGQVVAFETYTTGDKDFSAQLTKIKSTDAQVIFLPNYYTEVPLQIQQAHNLGIKLPFLGSDGWTGGELLKLCAGECDGSYLSASFAADNATPLAKKFVADYQAKYNTAPDDVASLTYDAYGMLFAAIQKAGKIDDRQAVRDALASMTEYNGVTGTLKFDGKTGDPIKSAVILQVKDGKFTYFDTANP
jgi:branched-chain amino acid transport system substrate-binding protein